LVTKDFYLSQYLLFFRFGDAGFQDNDHDSGLLLTIPTRGNRRFIYSSVHRA